MINQEIIYKIKLTRNRTYFQGTLKDIIIVFADTIRTLFILTILSLIYYVDFCTYIIFNAKLVILKYNELGEPLLIGFLNFAAYHRFERQ